MSPIRALKYLIGEIFKKLIEKFSLDELTS